MLLNEVMTKRMKRMTENKGGELQCLSVQQPTGHRIVGESPRQSPSKK